MTNGHVLFGTFGSGGDLFPLVAIAEALEELGVETTFVAPRGLGLALRRIGRRAYPLGDGSEMSFASDTRLLTTRFDGWASNRTTWNDYVGPTLEKASTDARLAIEGSGAELVVTTTYAAAVRVAARQLDVPQITATIYPQYSRLAEPGRRFAGSYLRAFRGLRCVPPGAPAERAIAFGFDEEACIISDPLLVGPLAPGQEVTGYPYWDSMPVGRPDEDDLAEWLGEGIPVVGVTLGSFIGAAPNALWATTVSAARSEGCRALLLNAPQPHAATADGMVRSTGFRPLSSVIEHLSALVHHGGLGTTMAAALGATPSVIVPQAFDQPMLARRVEAIGAGRHAASSAEIPSALSSVLHDGGILDAAQTAASSLVRPRAAAQHAAQIIARRLRRATGRSQAEREDAR